MNRLGISTQEMPDSFSKRFASLQTMLGAVLIATHEPTIDSFADQVLHLDAGSLVQAQVAA